jgi:hypothetical protein
MGAGLGQERFVAVAWCQQLRLERLCCWSSFGGRARLSSAEERLQTDVVDDAEDTRVRKQSPTPRRTLLQRGTLSSTSASTLAGQRKPLNSGSASCLTELDKLERSASTFLCYEVIETGESCCLCQKCSTQDLAREQRSV